MDGNVYIKGSGTIKHKAAATDHMIEGTGTLTLDGVTIDGNTANQTGRYSAIYFTGTTLIAEGTTFQNTVANAIYTLGGDWVYVNNCKFTGSTGHTGTLNETSYYIYMNQDTGIKTRFRITNNEFIGDSTDYSTGAIIAHGTEANSMYGVIENNYLYYCGVSYGSNNAGAIDLYQIADGSIVNNNTIEKAAYHAISVADSGNVSVSHNKIRNPHTTASVAILFQAYNHSTTLKHDFSAIDNDIEWNNEGVGIQVQGAAGQLTKGARIAHNRVYNTTYGIYLYYVDGAELSHNNVSTASEDGIRIRASEGLVKITGGQVDNTTGYHVRVYDEQLSLDLDISHVRFDTCATNPGLSIYRLRNVRYSFNHHVGSTTGSATFNAIHGKATLIGNVWDISPTFVAVTALERVADGFLTTGGYQRLSVEATADIEADASTTITLGIPANAKLLGAQLRVDTALAALETWDAAFSGGSTTAIASAQAVAQNTKVTTMYNTNGATDITSNTTNIAITKNGGGNFTAQGTIRAIVHYEVMAAMSDL
jgi:parallel beta-helix repeat protein